MNNIVVIGAGIAGYTCALKLTAKGMHVTLIEQNQLGGTCLNAGCIPVEFLSHKSKSSHDLANIILEKEKTIHMLRGAIMGMISAKKITYMTGKAKIEKDNSVLLVTTKQKIPYDTLILAIGARPIMPKIFDAPDVVVSDELLEFKKVPSTLVIAGAGSIGIEMARIFNNLGSKVTIVEKAPTILPAIPTSASDVVASSLRTKGIEILTGTEITDCSNNTAVCSNGIKITFDKLLVSVGRVGNTIQSEIPIDYEKGFIVTDEYFRTAQERIYAIGDCTEGPQLAHRAEYDGLLVAENILSDAKVKKNYGTIPSVVSEDPAVGSIGMLGDLSKVRMDFKNIGVAYTDESTSGFLELYIDDKKVIKGGVVVNKNAQEVLASLIPIVNSSLSVEQVINMVWAHPTPAEIIKEASKKALAL